MAEVLKVRKETKLHTTLALGFKTKADAGQFVMLWLPGVDEKPMSLSAVKKEGFEVTFKKVGPFTELLSKVKKGEKVGVRGPYGRGFSLKGRNICFVSGGVGLAPLMPLIMQASERKKNITIVAGFKNKTQILFQKKLSKIKADLHLITDDGSYGVKAFSSDMLEGILNQSRKKFDMIYCCGPELMMKKVLDISLKNNIPSQYSTERYMKCGTGVCGSCMISTLRVCKDGPVFTDKQLKNTEFGLYSRWPEGGKAHLHW